MSGLEQKITPELEASVTKGLKVRSDLASLRVGDLAGSLTSGGSANWPPVGRDPVSGAILMVGMRSGGHDPEGAGNGPQRPLTAIADEIATFGINPDQTQGKPCQEAIRLLRAA